MGGRWHILDGGPRHAVGHSLEQARRYGEKQRTRHGTDAFIDFVRRLGGR